VRIYPERGKEKRKDKKESPIEGDINVERKNKRLSRIEKEKHKV